MKTAIISPHTDDAIFSLGSLLSSPHNWGDVTVVSPFAGIPGDEAGRKKHITLRSEHEKACQILNLNIINGDFFDDVYGKQDERSVRGWFSKVLIKERFDHILIPLGIHHPDHELVRDIFLVNFKFTGFYVELPYRVLYPEIEDMLSDKVSFMKRLKTIQHNPIKEKAVETYVSQTLGGEVIKQLYVEERLWL